MKKYHLILFIICLCGLALVKAERTYAGNRANIPVPAAAYENTGDENEDDLFSDDDTMVDQSQVVDNTTGDELKEKRIGVSGEINTSSACAGYSRVYDWLYDLEEFPDREAHELFNQITADLFIDIRLKQGVKGFLSLGIGYYPNGIAGQNTIELPGDILPPDFEDNTVDLITTKHTDLRIKEFFLDANFRNKVYFRLGKQVLKWGTGYFWNPTDLINIERKDFLDLNKIREGTFGAKIHIPAGVSRNTYFFVGMNNAQTPSDIFLAGKYEFLVKNTEMSFSAWTKPDYHPVFGFDISGRIFDLDCYGELSVTNGSDVRVMDYETYDIVTKDGEIVPRASFGFTKFFDSGDIKDRLSLTLEFYYNHAGYEENILRKIQADTDAARRDKAKIDYMGKVYQPYMNSKYYCAFFSLFKKFMISDATFNVNGMMNLVDRSMALTAGIGYAPSMSDISFDLSLTGFFGDKFTEASFMGDRFSVNFGTRVLF